METTLGGKEENKEITQTITSFSFPRFGLDLSN